MTDTREARLPVWARRELEHLRQRLREAESSAREARLATGPEDSDVILDPYDTTPIRLGKGTRIRFLLSGGDPLRHYVDVRVSRGELDVLGGDTLAVIPWASNVVKVRNAR